MSIALRRTAALLLIPVFALTLTGALALLRVNAALLDPAAYTETLDRIDAYEFVYDAALPALLEESGIDLEAQRLAGLALSNEQVIDWVRQVFPPEFLRAAVGQAVNETLPYLAGRADSFSVHVPVEERADAAVDVARGAIDESGLYDSLFAEVVEPEVRRAAETYFDDLPFGLAPTNEEIVEGLREVVPRGWFDEQLFAAFDHAAPYLTGRAESFSVLIPLQERADAAQAVFARWIIEKAQGGFLEETAGSFIEAVVVEQDVLPWGLRFSSEDAAEAARAILASPWAEAAVAASAGATADYVTGRSDDLTVSIPTQGGVDVAAETFGGLADAKFRAFYDQLPVCPISAPVPTFSFSTAPDCRPPLIGHGQAKALTRFDPVREASDALIGAVSPSVTLTKSDLLGAAADDPALDSARGYLRDGYAFTNQDLRTLLADQVGSDAPGDLDSVRGWFRDGVRFDDADLREAVGAESVESMRAALRTMTALPLFLIAAALLLLLAAGFVGGRGWPDRLIWAGAALAIAGLLVIASAQIGAGLAPDLGGEAIRRLDLNQAIEAKAEEALNETVRAAVGPLRVQGAVVLAAGLAAIAAGGGLAYAGRRSARDVPADAGTDADA
ncbi:MAG: hypothetical protein J4F32_05130 [Dehalococcoidia bacterium]|nr:hypothetical protein [Dehalococcoidia bacterium]